jgi:hypothetical protein
MVSSRQSAVGGQQSAVGGTGSVRILIYNMLGEKSAEFNAPDHLNSSIEIDLTNYQAGIYFISTFQEHVLVQTEKLIIIK